MQHRQRPVMLGAVLCASAMAAGFLGLDGPPSLWQLMCIVLLGATAIAGVLLAPPGQPTGSPPAVIVTELQKKNSEARANGRYQLFLVGS